MHEFYRTKIKQNKGVLIAIILFALIYFGLMLLAYYYGAYLFRTEFLEYFMKH